MARTYCSKLTKEMLKEWGFDSVYYLPDFNITGLGDKNKWYIDRIWRKNSSKEFVHKRINITEAVCKHKYTQDKKYYKITFSIGNKMVSLPLSRFIYVWFNGDLKDGEVCDHIDNNPYNNHPSNLQKMDVGENLAKRYIDNPDAWTNQYGRTKDWNK